MGKEMLRKITATIIIVFLLLSYNLCFADELGDGGITSIDEAEAQQLINSFSPIREEIDSGILIGEIVCFDVSEDGRIAVGYLPSSSKAYISVYDPDYEFLYGYSFNLHGDYGIKWHCADLVVYVVRGNVLMSLDSSGSVIAMQESKAQGDHYLLDDFKSQVHEVDGRTYRLENGGFIFDFFASSYSKLSVEENGNIKVLFDNSSRHQAGSILIFAVVISAIIICIVIVVVRIKKLRLNRKKEEFES